MGNDPEVEEVLPLLKRRKRKRTRIYVSIAPDEYRTTKSLADEITAVSCLPSAENVQRWFDVFYNRPDALRLFDRRLIAAYDGKPLTSDDEKDPDPVIPPQPKRHKVKTESDIASRPAAAAGHCRTPMIGRFTDVLKMIDRRRPSGGEKRARELLASGITNTTKNTCDLLMRIMQCGDSIAAANWLDWWCGSPVGTVPSNAVQFACIMVLSLRRMLMFEDMEPHEDNWIYSIIRASYEPGNFASGRELPPGLHKYLYETQIIDLARWFGVYLNPWDATIAYTSRDYDAVHVIVEGWRLAGVMPSLKSFGQCLQGQGRNSSERAMQAFTVLMAHAPYPFGFAELKFLRGDVRYLKAAILSNSKFYIHDHLLNENSDHEISVVYDTIRRIAQLRVPMMQVEIPQTIKQSLWNGGLKMTDSRTMNGFVSTIMKYTYWERYQDSLIFEPTIDSKNKEIALRLDDPINPIPQEDWIPATPGVHGVHQNDLSDDEDDDDRPSQQHHHEVEEDYTDVDVDV